MPSPRTFPTTPQPVNQDLVLPESFPELPPAIMRRFGAEAEQYSLASRQWWSRTRRALAEQRTDLAAPLNRAVDDLRNVRSEYVAADATLAASFDEKIEVVTSATEALAERTTNLEASVDAPGTGMLARINIIETTYATQAFAEAKKTEAITASNGFSTAAVGTESIARSTADGHLSGKYTLSVAAGNVATGMNISSATGPGTHISEIVFQSDKVFFQTASSGVGGDRIRLLELAAANIVFGTDIASNNYNPGVAGWKLSRAGVLDAYAGIFRGTVDVGSGDSRFVVNTAAMTYGSRFKIFSPSGNLDLRAGRDAAGAYAIGITSSTDDDTRLRFYSNAPGLPFVMDVTKDYFALNGLSGSPALAGLHFSTATNTLKVFAGVEAGYLKAVGGVEIGGGSSFPLRTTSGRLYMAPAGANRWFFSDSGNLVSMGGAITKETNDGYTVRLSDGFAGIEFKASGGALYARINGGPDILLG